VHLAHEGLGGHLVTDTGAVNATGAFEDVLLNSLAVIKQSRGHDLASGTAALRSSSGLVVAVVGRLSPGVARQLAASRHDSGPAIALLLAVSTWAAPGAGSPEETDQAAGILRAAGWRVARLEASTQLAVAWQQIGTLTSKPLPSSLTPGAKGGQGGQKLPESPGTRGAAV
jgi:hypothetical protein